MADHVVITTEEDSGAGWVFGVVVRANDVETEHKARLSWVDFDHWCGGGTAPADLARLVLEAALSDAELGGLPDSFDLSTLRRKCRGLDDIVSDRLGRSRHSGASGQWAENRGEMPRRNQQ